MGQDEGQGSQQWADAARTIKELAQGVRGRVHGLESRQDLEKIIGLAREIERGSGSRPRPDAD